MTDAERLKLLPLYSLRRHLHENGINEVARRLSLGLTQQEVNGFEGSLKAAALAFMTHDIRLDETGYEYGSQDPLFSIIRRTPDFDTTMVERVLESAKNLLFDSVSA